QLGGGMQLLGQQVAHEPVAVVDQHGRRAGTESAFDGRVGFRRHQASKPVILPRVKRISRVRLILMNDAGNAFHVNGDVDLHDFSRGRCPVTHRGRTMRARVWGIATMIAAAACSPRGDQRDSNLLQQGRLYTAWLYGSQYEKLWD